MRKTIIFGMTDLAELLYFHIRQNDTHEVAAFAVDPAYRRDETFLGLPLVGYDDIDATFPPGAYGVFVCIGYSGMNSYRRDAIGRFSAKGYEVLNFVHPNAQVDAARIGKGNLFFQNTVADAYTTLGDGNILYAGAQISHHSAVGNNNFFAVKSCIAGHVTIGDECFFGAHSTVRNGVTIGDRTLAGANVFIPADTDEDSVWTAPPALQSKRKSRDVNI